MFLKSILLFSENGLKTFYLENNDSLIKSVLHRFCSRMSILRVFIVKNHSVESDFFADFERFWMSKNDKLKLPILGQKDEMK